MTSSTHQRLKEALYNRVALTFRPLAVEVLAERILPQIIGYITVYL